MNNTPNTPAVEKEVQTGQTEQTEAVSTKVFDLNIKSFILALIMLALLMVGTYVVTMVVPSGEYQRTVTEDGQALIQSGTYQQIAKASEGGEGGISFLQWLGSPFLMLFSDGGISADGVTILAISFFLLVIGGAFSSLDEAGVLSYMLGSIYNRFNKHKYGLLAAITLFFMAIGSLIGSFEEVVPLVPIAVALAYALRWDALVGLGMSILAVGCGFTCGITNPFTVGVAQSLAGLPLFSGISLRLVSFALIYGVLMLFLTLYARKVEKKQEKSLVYDAQANMRWIEIQYSFKYDAKKSRALKCFAVIMGLGIVLILASAFISTLSSIIMPVVGVVFLVAGTVSSLVSGLSFGKYLRQFGKGVLSVLPAVLLLLMASSIKYILTESKCLDTILYSAEKMTAHVSPLVVVLIIYALSLLVNLFVASGSAEAALLIPLLAPLAELTGISKQLVVLSYIFGDGFSDLFYPTSPILLISLGLVGVSFGKWIRWSLKIQIVILAVTIGILALGYYCGGFFGYVA